MKTCPECLTILSCCLVADGWWLMPTDSFLRHRLRLTVCPLVYLCLCVFNICIYNCLPDLCIVLTIFVNTYLEVLLLLVAVVNVDVSAFFILHISCVILSSQCNLYVHAILIPCRFSVCLLMVGPSSKTMSF